MNRKRIVIALRLRQFRFSNYVRIECVTPVFGPAGARTGFNGCDDWISLSK